ncbi:hypothetical protein AHF37_05895 [Paragonimus kellicotti]|nr:hypothetical protein AHF37_05895 [Paragonimus kellicotti]
MAIDPSAGRRHQQDVIVSSGYDTPDAYNWGEADVDNWRRHQQDVIVSSGYDTPDAYNWGEADVDNYIEAYDCRPPPIFIPLITLAEFTGVVEVFEDLIHSIHGTVVVEAHVDSKERQTVAEVSGEEFQASFRGSTVYF